MRPKTDPNAIEVKGCIRCKDAWVENPVYNFCPKCMNDFYIENGYKPVKWVTNEHFITVGIEPEESMNE